MNSTALVNLGNVELERLPGHRLKRLFLTWRIRNAISKQPVTVAQKVVAFKHAPYVVELALALGRTVSIHPFGPNGITFMMPASKEVLK